MREETQLRIGSVLSYFQMGIGIIIGLVYTPVMIKVLGQSEYGLYNTIASTISMISLLSLGFNSSYIRFFSKYKRNNDKISIYKLNGLFIIIFSIIALVALISGIFLSFNLNIVFANGLNDNEYSIAFILMLLLTVNLSISFPMSVFANIISANQKFIFLKLIGMLKTIFGPLVTLPLLLMGFRSIAMVSVTLIISVFTDMIYCYYVIHVLKNKFLFSGFDKGLFKNLFVYTSFIAVNLIIDQINWNVDKLLLARFKGTEMVAIYSVGYSLYSYYMQFSTSISSVFTPKIHMIISNTEDSNILRNNLTNLFTKVGRIQFIILGLIASGIVFFGRFFITNIWTSSEYMDSYYVTLLLVIPSTIALIQNLGIEIQRALNRHKFRSMCYAIMAIINLVMSIFLCQLYGAIGSAVGTAFSLLIANGFIMNIYYHKYCNIDIKYFWKSIIRLSKGMIIPLCVGILEVRFISYVSLINYFLSIIFYVFIYIISMWIFGMNHEEKQLISKPVNRYFRRRYER